MPLDIAVLISGTGSNLMAIQGAIEAGACDARIAAVISDRPAAPGLAYAESRGLSTAVVRPRAFPDRPTWDGALADAVAACDPAVIVLAGFMRIVGPGFVRRFPGRIINVHPALLPAFPGTDGPAQAIAAGVRISGCTVHVVDEGVDTGPIVAQAAVPVLQADDAESLHARIQRAEHRLLPAVIHGVARGDIGLGERPHVRTASEDDACLLSPPLSDGT